MIAGAYSLHLYCDNESDDHAYKEFPHEYVDEFGSSCRRRARKAGWKLYRDGRAICPKCNMKKKANP